MTRFASRLACSTMGLTVAGALSGGLVMPAIACPRVPDIQVEVMPRPPVSPTQLTWQPGHWNYVDREFVWEPGRYIPSATGQKAWVGGGFTLGPTGCTWVPAHWQTGEQPPA